MMIRRCSAVLAAATLLTAGGTSTALAESPSPSAPPAAKKAEGLFGQGDPTYDGVWRQSLALIAQDAAGLRPAPEAVDWLVGQQCADGGFAPYRPAGSGKKPAPCDHGTQQDTNMTAAAVQALVAVGGKGEGAAAVEKGVRWLKSAQHGSGGWGYKAHGAPDTNSTALVVGALTAAGEDAAAAESTGGHTPFDALAGLTVPCGQHDAGAFVFQAPGHGQQHAASGDATAAGVVAAVKRSLLDPKPGRTAKNSPGDSCTHASGEKPAELATAAARWLEKSLTEGTHLMSAMPGAEEQPDYGNTADAAVALSAAGHEKSARAVTAWLEKNAVDWAKTGGPAAYAQLVLAARATGGDPGDFGGTDLVRELGALGPAATTAGSGEGDGKGGPQEDGVKDESAEDGDDSSNVWWYVGAFLVAGIGIGFLLSGRGRSRGTGSGPGKSADGGTGTGETGTGSEEGTAEDGASTASGQADTATGSTAAEPQGTGATNAEPGSGTGTDEPGSGTGTDEPGTQDGDSSGKDAK